MSIQDFARFKYGLIFAFGYVFPQRLSTYLSSFPLTWTPHSDSYLFPGRQCWPLWIPLSRCEPGPRPRRGAEEGDLRRVLSPPLRPRPCGPGLTCSGAAGGQQRGRVDTELRGVYRAGVSMLGVTRVQLSAWREINSVCRRTRSGLYF